ncbi:MAG: hypothetical protein HXS54_18745 [Theionarchaea archaeon]|nr:hypothetical protein [Theionarchaea archaeon]
MEFWNKIILEKSWEVLQKISKEFDFVLIGGWAVYLWTNSQKSKDVDIIIEYETLDYLKSNYYLKKNDHLKKYEIIIDEVDIDIYLPYFSNLGIPVEEIIMHKVKVKGFTTLPPELLLILKQRAEIDRRDSVKGQKDSVDILNLLMSLDIDWEKYREYVETYNLREYKRELFHIINTFDMLEYVGMNPREYKVWKKDILENL